MCTIEWNFGGSLLFEHIFSHSSILNKSTQKQMVQRKLDEYKMWAKNSSLQPHPDNPHFYTLWDRSLLKKSNKKKQCGCDDNVGNHHHHYHHHNHNQKRINYEYDRYE